MQDLELHLASTTISVAVITPYREQKALLRKRFEELWGKKTLKNVAIETIDSYQGRQVDVVILSCVRAGSGGGLGFVNDVRRMNVAITRARKSLWILGALATLRANKEWQALIQDAEERKLVVSPACAVKLFPELDKVQKKVVPDKQPMSSVRKPTNSLNVLPLRPLAARPMAPVVPMKKVTKQQPLGSSSRPMKKLQDAEKNEYQTNSVNNAKANPRQKNQKRARPEKKKAEKMYPSIPEGR
jgi:senataxin